MIDAVAVLERLQATGWKVTLSHRANLGWVVQLADGNDAYEASAATIPAAVEAAVRATRLSLDAKIEQIEERKAGLDEVSEVEAVGVR